MKKGEFKVRDLTKRGFYLKHDTYLNGWAKYCGWKATLVYDSLCRHADRDQEAFPSIKLMAEEHGVSRYSILRGVKTLKEWNIIKFIRCRNKRGRFLHNTYYLLDKGEWKQPIQVAHSDMDYPSRSQQPIQVAHSDYKDTHIKDTHTLGVPKVIAGDAIYRHKMNKRVNLILRRYKEEFRRLPTESEARQRQIAGTIKRSIEAFLRKTRGKNPTDDDFEAVLDKIFGWFMDKDFAEKTYKLRTFQGYAKTFLSEIEISGKKIAQSSPLVKKLMKIHGKE